MTLRELSAFGAVSGAVPMAAVVSPYELQFADSLANEYVSARMDTRGTSARVWSLNAARTFI